MSDTDPTNNAMKPMCPGVAAALDETTPRYVMLPISVFWKDKTYPDAQYVYMDHYSFKPLDPAKVMQINEDILAAANASDAFDGKVSKVRFGAIIPVQMTAEQAAAEGWRVISGAPAAPVAAAPPAEPSAPQTTTEPAAE